MPVASVGPPPDGYRPCAGAAVFNAKGLVFIAQRSGFDPNGTQGWQCPQGGLDPGEDPEAGARRELVEETGISSVRLVAEAGEWLSYDFPPAVAGKRFKKYVGQSQLWFAYVFGGEDSEINLNTSSPAEFQQWDWVAFKSLPGLIVPFKRPVYESMVAAFAPVATGLRRQGD